jgi:esterase/lipase superfamily enzyme
VSPDPAVRREVSSWWSQRLGMHMPIARYGHWGPAMLLFPTWKSDYLEAEARGLIATLQPHLAAGRFNVFCINSIAPQAWCNDEVPMAEKVRRQVAYSAYVEEEVVPHIRRVLKDEGTRILAAGASFGAFFAANALFRRPDLFFGLVGMSGFYRLDKLLNGYHDDSVYFNNPAWFVPNLKEGPGLDLLRHHSRVHLLAARGQWEYPEETEHFAGVLRAKGIPHWLDIWGPDAPHDWPTWQRMLDVVIRERLAL